MATPLICIKTIRNARRRAVIVNQQSLIGYRSARGGRFRYNLEASSPTELESAPLAQLDRASGYEPEGREFESLRAHHKFLIKHRVL